MGRDVQYWAGRGVVRPCVSLFLALASFMKSDVGAAPARLGRSGPLCSMLEVPWPARAHAVMQSRGTPRALGRPDRMVKPCGHGAIDGNAYSCCAGQEDAEGSLCFASGGAWLYSCPQAGRPHASVLERVFASAMDALRDTRCPYACHACGACFVTYAQITATSAGGTTHRLDLYRRDAIVSTRNPFRDEQGEVSCDPIGRGEVCLAA